MMDINLSLSTFSFPPNKRTFFSSFYAFLYQTMSAILGKKIPRKGCPFGVKMPNFGLSRFSDYLFENFFNVLSAVFVAFLGRVAVYLLRTVESSGLLYAAGGNFNNHDQK